MAALEETQELMENTSHVRQSSEFELFLVVKSNKDKKKSGRESCSSSSLLQKPEIFFLFSFSINY